MELLNWLNAIIEADYPKIEQCSDGIAFCQILDAVFPKIVPLSKLNFNANNKDDYYRNIKVLDEVGHKLKLPYQIQTKVLAQGKF